MTTTSNLGLTLLESGQLQPDVTINEALVAIDAAFGGVGTKIDINAQSGTSYTLGLADAGKMVILTNESPVTVEVPTEASIAFPIGTQILLVQGGAGQVTLDAESSVIVNSPETLGLRKQYAQAALVKIGSDEWLLEGNLEAA